MTPLEQVPLVTPSEFAEQAAPTTDRDGHGSAGAAATASAGPYTATEFADLVRRIWSFRGEQDPTRFDELLTWALARLGSIAVNGLDRDEREQVITLLRQMEQRVLSGPDEDEQLTLLEAP